MRRTAYLALALPLLFGPACSGNSDSTKAPQTAATDSRKQPTATPVKKQPEPVKPTTPDAKPVPLDVPAGTGTVKRASFTSKALGVDKEYMVYLPPGYDTNKNARYPVIYYLHGLGGHEGNWPNLDLPKQADALKLGAIVIMPDGDDSFYVNAASMWQPYERCLKQRRPFGRETNMKKYCVKKADYETYMTKDLIAHVDATYRTLGSRAGRGIAGLSMGGYGALMLSLRHKDLYAAAASHSGVDSLLYKGPFPYVKGKVQVTTDIKASLKRLGFFGPLFRQVYGTELANWKSHDPATLAQSLKPGELALYLDCGTEDEFRLHNGMQHLHDILLSRKIDHAYYIGPGHHRAPFWKDRVDDSLRFFMKHLARPVTTK